jgi:hypothetical protein
VFYSLVATKHFVIHEAATVGFGISVVESFSSITVLVCGFHNLLLGKWIRLMYVRIEVFTVMLEGSSLLQCVMCQLVNTDVSEECGASKTLLPIYKLTSQMT